MRAAAGAIIADAKQRDTWRAFAALPLSGVAHAFVVTPDGTRACVLPRHVLVGFLHDYGATSAARGLADFDGELAVAVVIKCRVGLLLFESPAETA